MTTSVFEKFRQEAWPFKFHGRIHVGVLAGGVPTNPKVAEGWIKSKITTTDQQIREMVADAMVARGVNPESGELDREQIISEVAALKSLNGFKRDPEKGLYIEGRQLKAALKEAVSVAVATERIEQKGWGATRKWITKFFPEHVFVLEDRLYLNRSEVSGINQRFVTTHMGARALQYEEYVEGAEFDFTIVTDYDFTETDWAQIWLTGEMQGIGAARSAGFGRYTVIGWERVP